MSATKEKTENLDEIKRERDKYFLFVLQLIHADSAERNRILNSMRPKKEKRPAGSPKKHTPESDHEYLESVEFVKTELTRQLVANNSSIGRISDDMVLAAFELAGLQSNGLRLGHIHDSESKAQRKTIRNTLGRARKSRKLK